MCSSFSIAQIEESLRSFHANISGGPLLFLTLHALKRTAGSNFNVGVNGPYVRERSPTEGEEDPHKLRSSGIRRNFYGREGSGHRAQQGALAVQGASADFVLYLYLL
eukprot:757627-Hanusia_phi.AAC.2